MKRLDQKGFALLSIVMVLITVGLVAGAGVYYFNHQKKDDPKPTTTTTSTVPDGEKAPVTDPTADWIPYTSKDNKVSLKYPKTWVTATHPEFCGDGIVLLGPNSTSVGKCGADGARAFGEVGITWMPESVASEACGLSESFWHIDSKETVMVSGISAQKSAGTFLTDATAGGGQAKGNKTVQYCFTANNTRYVATYTKWSDYPDALNDFNTMITKTLKIAN